MEYVGLLLGGGKTTRGSLFYSLSAKTDTGHGFLQQPPAITGSKVSNNPQEEGDLLEGVGSQYELVAPVLC